MIKKSQNHYPCDFPRTDEKISGGGGMRPILECQGGNKEKSLGTTAIDYGRVLQSLVLPNVITNITNIILITK